MRKLVAATVSAAFAAVALAGPALSATPAKGKLSAATPVVKWTGTHNVSNPAPFETRCAVGCESFPLTIEAIAGQDVKIKIDVPDNVDFDVHIYGPNGAYVTSGGGGFLGEDETAIIKRIKKSGTYDIRIQPYLVLPNSTYKAVATYTPAKK